MEDNPDVSENVFMSSDKSQGIVPSELNATKESLLSVNKNDNSHKQQNNAEDIQTTKVLASNIAETQRGYGKEKINKGNIFERKLAGTSSQSQTSRSQDELITSCKSHETGTKYSEFGKQPVGANNSFTYTILEAVCQDFQNIGQESSATSNNSINQPSNSYLCSASKESCSQKSATSKKAETYISNVEKPHGISVVLESSTDPLGFSNVSNKTQIPVCEDIAVSCKPLGKDVQIVDNVTKSSVSKECNINSKSNATKKGKCLRKKTSKTLHSCKPVTPESQTKLQISSAVESVERSKSDELTSSSTTNKPKDIVNNVHNSVQTTGTVKGADVCSTGTVKGADVCSTGTVKGADVCSTGTFQDTNVQQITDVYSQLGIGFQMETVCENIGKTAAQPQTKIQNRGKRKYVWKNKHPSNFSKKNESIKARNRAGINKMTPEIRKTNSRRISAKMKRQWAEELKKEGHLTCQISGCYQRYVTVANFQTHFKWCTGKTNKGLQHCPYCDSLILADQDAALHHMEVEHPDKIEEYREKLAKKTPNKFHPDTSVVVETNVVKETCQDSKMKNQAISENIISKKLSKKYFKKFKNQKNLNLSTKENLLKPKKTCLKQKLKALGKSVVSDFSKSKKCVRFNDIVQQINSVSSKPETENDSEAAENIPTKLVKQKKKIRELPEDLIEVSNFNTVNAESTDYFDAVIDDSKVSESELQLTKSDIVRKFGSKSRLLLNTKEYRRFTEFVIPTRDWASARKTYSRSRSSLLAESPLKKAVQPQEIIDMHQLQNADAPSEITLNSSQEESILELKNNVSADGLEISTSEPNVATSGMFASYSRSQNLRTKKLSKVSTAGVAQGQNAIKNLILDHQEEFSKAGSNFPDKLLIGESNTVINAADTFISIDSQLALNSNERLKMQSDVLAASLSKETNDRSIISKSYPETPRTVNKGRITCYDNAYRQTSQRHTIPKENSTLLGSTNSSNVISPCNNINQSHTLPAISASNYNNSVSTVSYTPIQTPKKRGRPKKKVNENINIPALQNSQEITDSELQKNVLQSANAIGKSYSHGVRIQTMDISNKKSKAKVHVSRENGIKLPNECSCECSKNVIKKKRGRPRKDASVGVTPNSPNELLSGPHPANSNCKFCTCSKIQKVLKGVKSKKRVVSKHSITSTMKLKKKINLSDESASSAFDLLTQTTAEKPVRKRGRPRKNPLCDEMQLKGKTKVRSIQKAIKTGLTFVLDKACKYVSHKGSHSKRYITKKQQTKTHGKQCINSNDIPDGKQSENINIIGSTDINQEIPVSNLENICIKPIKVPKRGRSRKFVITNQITSENETQTTRALENKEQEIEQLLNIDKANKDLLNETSSKVCEEPADTVDKITLLLENNSDKIEVDVLKHSQNVTSEACEVSEKFASVDQNVTFISEKDAPLSQTVEINHVKVIHLSNYRPEQINSEFQTGRNILPDSYENQNETAVNMIEKTSQLTAIKERKTLEIKSADEEIEKISVQETLNCRFATEKLEGKLAANNQNEVIASNFSQTPETVIVSEIDRAAAPTEALTTTLVDSMSINKALSASENETNDKSEAGTDTLSEVDKFKNNETNSEALDERKTDCLNDSSKIVQEEGILDAEVKQSSKMDNQYNVENSLNASGEEINKVCVTTEELSSKLVSSVTVADGTEASEKPVLRNDAFPPEKETQNTHTVENKEQETEQLPNISEVNKDLFNNASSSVRQEPTNDISECANIKSGSKTVKEKSPDEVVEICTDSVQTTAKYISCENSEFLKSKDNLVIKKDEENTFLSVNEHDKLPETSNVITEETVHGFDTENIKIFNQSKLSSNNADSSPSIHQVCLSTDEVPKIAVVTLSETHKQTTEVNSSGVSNECIGHTEILKSIEVNISNEKDATPKLNKRGRPRKNKAVKILDDGSEGKRKDNAESHQPISCQSETAVLRFSERQRNRKLSLDGSVLSKSDDALCSKINSSHNTEITPQKCFRKSKKCIMDLNASDTQNKPEDKSDLHLSQSSLHQSGSIIRKSGKRGRPRKYPIEKVLHSDQSLLDSSTVKSLHINEDVQNVSGEIKLNENKGLQTNTDETHLQQKETQVINKQNSAYKSNSVTEEQTAVETDPLISSNKAGDPLTTNTVRKCSRKGRPRKCSRYAQLNQSDNKIMPSDQIMDNSLKLNASEDRKKIISDQNLSTKGEQNDLTNTVHNPQESVIEPNKPNNNVGQELNIQCSTVSGKKRKKHSSLEIPKKMKKNEEKDFHTDKQKCVQNLAFKEKTETKIDVSHSRKSRSDVKIDKIALDAEEKTNDKQEESKYSETENNVIGRKRKIVKRVSALISSSESNADEDSEPDKMNNETHSQVDRLSTKCKRKKEDVIANNDFEEEMVGDLEGSVDDLIENDKKNNIIQSKTKKLPTRQAAVKARKMLVNLMKLNKQPSQQENSSDSDYKEQDKSPATESESAEDEEEEDDDEVEQDKILLPINKVEEKLEKFKDYFVAPKAFEKKKASPELFKKWNEDLDTTGKTICENEGCGKALETLLGMKYHYENSPCLKIRSKWKCLLCDKELRPGPRTMYRHMCDVHFELTPKIDNSKIKQKRHAPSGRKHRIKPGINEIKLAVDFHCKYKYENLMTEWKPKKVMWRLQNESEYDSYLPPLKTSPNIKIEDTKEEKEVPWFTLKCFESMSAKADSSHCTFFVGGSVWGSAWCPTPIDVKATQFIALATCSSMDLDHPLLSVDESKGLLQFWDAGVLQPNIQDNKPILRLAISHNHGNIWDMAWCPSGCWEDPSTVCDTEDLPRLGLLAVACADSYIRIYSIPHPVSLNCDPNCLPIYCSWPVAVLHSPNGEPCLSSQRTMCTSVSWQRTDKCELIAGGFGNGMICIWHVTSSSSLLTKCHENAQKTILPYLSFHAHKASITSLDWAPLPGGRWIASSAFDADFKIWDLDDVSLPLTTQEKVKQKKLPRSIQWKPRWCGLFAALDDCYTGSSSFYKECGYYNFPFRFLSCHNSCTWSISVSEWLNTEASGDAAGEVTGTILCHLAKNVKYTKQMYDRRIPIFRTELRCIEETTRSSIDNSEGNFIASLPTSVSHPVLSECQAEISQIADAEKEIIKNITDDLNDSVLRAVNNYLPNTTLTVTKTNQELTESNSEAKCKESRISRDVCVENDLQTEAEIVNSLSERTVVKVDSNNSKSIELQTPAEIIEVVNNLAERAAVKLDSNNSETVELEAEIMEIVNDLTKKTVDSINVNDSKAVELPAQTEIIDVSNLTEIIEVHSFAERAAVNGDYANSKTVKLQTEVTDIVNNLAEIVEVVNNLAERAVNMDITSRNTVTLQEQMEIMKVVNDLAKMVASNMDSNDRTVELPTQAEIVEIINNLLERAAVNVNSNNTKANGCITPVEILEVVNDLVEETVVHVDNNETPAKIIEVGQDFSEGTTVHMDNNKMVETPTEIVEMVNDLTEKVVQADNCETFETSEEIIKVVNDLTERAAVHADNFETSKEIVNVVNNLTERAAVHADNFETWEEIVKVVNDLTERVVDRVDNCETVETPEEIVKVVHDFVQRVAIHVDNNCEAIEFTTPPEVREVVNDLVVRAAVQADNSKTVQFIASAEILEVVNDLSEKTSVHVDNSKIIEYIASAEIKDNDLAEKVAVLVNNNEASKFATEIMEVVNDLSEKASVYVDSSEIAEFTTEIVENDISEKAAVHVNNSETDKFTTEIMDVVNDISEKVTVCVDNSETDEFTTEIVEVVNDLLEKAAVHVDNSETDKFTTEIMDVVNDISEKVTLRVDNSETDEFTTEVVKVVNGLLEKTSVHVTNRETVEFIVSTEITTDNDHTEKAAVHVNNSETAECTTEIVEVVNDLLEKAAVHVDNSETDKFTTEIMDVVNDISEKVTLRVDNSETDEFTTEVVKVVNGLLEKTSVHVTNRETVEFIVSTEITTDNDHTEKVAVHVNNSETAEFTTEIVEVVNDLLEKAAVHVDNSETDVVTGVNDLLEKASIHVDNSETAEFIVPAEIKAVDLARKDTDNSETSAVDNRETFAVDNKEAFKFTTDILKVVNDLTERAVICAESNNKVLTTPTEILEMVKYLAERTATHIDNNEGAEFKTPVETLEVINNLAARAAIYVDSNEKVEFTTSPEILDVVNDLTERTANHVDSETVELTSPTGITAMINDLVEIVAAHVDSNSNETIDFTTPADIRKIIKNLVEKAVIHVDKCNSETTGFAAPAEIVEVVSELVERVAVCVNGGNNKSVKFKPPAEIMKVVNNLGEGFGHKDNSNSDSSKPIGFKVVTDVTDVVNDLVERTSVMQESNAVEPQNAEKIVGVVNDLSESATVHEGNNSKTVKFKTPAEISEVVNNLVKSIVVHVDGVNNKLSEFKTSTEIMEGVNDLSASVVCVDSNKSARCNTSEIIEVDNCSAENIDMVGSNNKSFNKSGINDSPTFKDFGKDLSLTPIKPSEVLSQNKSEALHKQSQISVHKNKKFQIPETVRKGKFLYSSNATLMDTKFPMMKPKISHVNHEVKIISEVLNDILNTVEDTLHFIVQDALPPTQENHGNTMTIHNNFEQNETSRLCNSSVTGYGKESPAAENTAPKNYPPAPIALDFKQDSENIIAEVIDHLMHTASELAVFNSNKYNQCVEPSDSCHVKSKAISKCEYDKTVHAHETDHNFATSIGNIINEQFAENDETVIVCNKERQNVSNENNEKCISNELLDSVGVITSKNMEHNIPLTDECISDNLSVVSVTTEKDFRPTECSVNINNEIMTCVKIKHSNEQAQNVSSELMQNKQSNINRNNDKNDDAPVVQTLCSKISEKRCEVVVSQAVDDVVHQLLDKCQEMFVSHPSINQESATMSTLADDPSIMQTPGEEAIAIDNCVVQELEDFMVIDDANVQKSNENTVIGGEVTIRHEPVEAMIIEDEVVVRLEPAEAMVIDEETTVIRHEPGDAMVIDDTCVMLQESTKHAVVVSNASNRQEPTEVMITEGEPGIAEKSTDVIFVGNGCIRQGSIQPMVIETDITNVQEAVTENTINNQEISFEMGIPKENKTNQQESLAQDIVTGIRPSSPQEMSVNIPSLSDSAKNALLSKTRQYKEVFSSNNVIKPTEESNICETGGTNSSVSDKQIGQDSAKNLETYNNFHEMSRKYGMVFKDTDLRDISKIPAKDSERLRKSDLMNRVLPNEYPMASINCVKWNPNFGSHLWLFSVGHAGIARLSCVSGLHNSEAANILENSVKSHQNR